MSRLLRLPQAVVNTPRRAVQQNEENIALNCGFTDARWNSNRADHENWCQAVGADAAAKHTAARKTALDKCRYAIAHPVNPTDKLGIEQTPKPRNPKQHDAGRRGGGSWRHSQGGPAPRV